MLLLIKQNRLSYSQLAVDANTSINKAAPVKAPGRGRGRGDTKKLIAKDTTRLEANPSREKVFDAKETYAAFSIRFVRLNGVLFTRTRYMLYLPKNVLLFYYFLQSWFCLIYQILCILLAVSKHLVTFSLGQSVIFVDFCHPIWMRI